jgi:hypothetical protein
VPFASGSPLANNAAPREAIERLNREVIKLMQEPVVLDRFKVLAVDLAGVRRGAHRIPDAKPAHHHRCPQQLS